jgi:hypothetical protein
MWTKVKKLLLAGMVLWLATPAFGEYYQYTDQDGVMRFTDDITGVPPNQRPDVKTYKSVKSNSVQATTDVRAAGMGANTRPSPGNGTRPSDHTWAERSSRNAAELNRMQAKLNETFMALQNERTTLVATAPGPGASSTESVAYRKQVRALNARIDRYEAQFKEYEERQKAFNAEFRK